jgi:hypothetical protein
MPRLIVQTRDLAAGDLCVHTGERVIARPTAGISTPRGKLDVPLRRDRTAANVSAWGRRSRRGLWATSTCWCRHRPSLTPIAEVFGVDTDQPSE